MTKAEAERAAHEMLGDNLRARLKRKLREDCQSAVREKLRAPSQAKFYKPPSYHVEGDTVTIIGEVEGMNGYGGYGRIGYFCTRAKQDPSTEQRVLVIDLK